MTDDKDVDLSAEAEVPEEEASSVEASQAAADNAEATPESGEGVEAASEEKLAAGDVSAEESDAEGADDQAGGNEAAADEIKVVNEQDASEDDAEAAMMKMLEELPEEADKAGPDDIDFGSASVGNAEFQQLQEPISSSEPSNIDLLMDVDLPVSIELGRTKMAIADILGLGPGSVVELNRLAGEPVDLLVNYKVVAKGEVVVVDENFGLRITQLMTPEERLKALAEE